MVAHRSHDRSVHVRADDFCQPLHFSSLALQKQFCLSNLFLEVDDLVVLLLDGTLAAITLNLRDGLVPNMPVVGILFALSLQVRQLFEGTLHVCDLGLQFICLVGLQPQRVAYSLVVFLLASQCQPLFRHLFLCDSHFLFEIAQRIVHLQAFALDVNRLLIDLNFQALVDPLVVKEVASHDVDSVVVGSLFFATKSRFDLAHSLFEGKPLVQVCGLQSGQLGRQFSLRTPQHLVLAQQLCSSQF